MKSFTALISTALLAVAVAAQQFTLNTPIPPTVIFPGGHPDQPALQQYPGLTGNSFTWRTNITAGTLVGFQLTDSNGAVAQTSSVQIQSGPDTSCLNGGGDSSAAGSSTTGSASAPAGSSTGTATAPGGTSTSAVTTGGSSAGSSATTGTSRAPSGTSSSSSSSASATGGSSNNGGFVNAASIGAVGVLSAVAALVLA
ncbi:hypothetical protein BN946_scf184883.g21 [Trametes cinnabarina]|uniref:Uncharacterized protein n=1 Tax=Pycnoporus cinnabarinus TaxID=5643 RepID=A0A060STJ7_PYCCI|nr:hypothetical protein BN946_scf184883.g21 [Trametes cinnabarina]